VFLVSRLGVFQITRPVISNVRLEVLLKLVPPIGVANRDFASAINWAKKALLAPTVVVLLVCVAL
jgi:hypothetical protein